MSTLTNCSPAHDLKEKLAANSQKYYQALLQTAKHRQTQQEAEISELKREVEEKKRFYMKVMREQAASEEGFQFDVLELRRVRGFFNLTFWS